MSIGRPPRTLEQRQTLFASQCETQPNGCVLWLGRLDKDGYGRIKIDNKQIRIHRLVLQWAGVVVPDDLMVLHACDTPRCVNPDHLRVGTALDNAQDCTERCRRVNVVWGDGHWCAKLTPEQVQQIRASDLPSTAAAKVFGCSPRTIRDIRSRRRWSRLP